MKSFGKSFGVRAGIGAATILSGVYAAALAQKDRQDHSVDWTAKPPSLGQPVAPIEGQVSLAKPPADPVSDALIATTSERLSAGENAGGENPVQLVQHTEPAGLGMELPASLSSVSAATATLEPGNSEPGNSEPGNSEPANWTLPPAGNPVLSPEIPGNETPAMALPVVGGSPQAEFVSPFAAEPTNEAGSPAVMGAPVAMGVPIESSPNAEGAVAESGPSAFSSPQIQMQGASEGTSSTFGQPSNPAVATPADTLPADLATPASSPFAPLGSDTNQVAESGVITPDAAVVTPGVPSVTPTLASGPANLLRADASAGNALRGNEMSAINRSANELTANELSAGADRSIQAFATPGVEAEHPATSFAEQGGPQFSQPPTAVEAFGSPSSVIRTASQPAVGVASLSTAAPVDPGAGQSVSGQQLLAGQQPLMGSAQVVSSENQVVNPGNAFPGSVAPGYPAAMEQPLAAMPINPNATVDSPGERRLEGAQTPSVVIQKRAPAEVKVGKPAAFVIQVQNVGTVEALDVQVQDRVPAGMRLVDASPSPVQQGSLLVWQLGSMPAGDERTLTLQLVPEQEGELGSVARVSFEAAASVRTVATRPELKVTQNAPETVLIGQQLEIELEVSNPGSGAATGVVLQEDVPEGLDHPKGRQLDNALGTLAPGEVRKQILRLRAVAPGVIQNTIRLTGEDGLSTEDTVTVQVVAPEIRVAMKGPARRYLERSTTYQVDVANAGTADATNVEVSVQLARGLKFVSTDYEGQYDPSRHSVFWSLAQLPAGQSGSVPLTLLPVEEGEQVMLIDARADLGITAKAEQKTTVEGFASLGFEISNPSGPIELGAETTYQVRVTNSGSKADSNIRVQLQLPQGLELISADSEAGTDGRGLVAFQPRPNLAPGDELKFSVRLRGTAAGTHLVKAIIVSDQSKVPVTKEASTLVYTDQ